MSGLDAYISRYGDFVLTTMTTIRLINLSLAHVRGVKRSIITKLAIGVDDSIAVIFYGGALTI